MRFALARLWVITAALLLSNPTTAQTLYRCGNQYQDKPCEKGEPAKRISAGAKRTASAATPASDAECARRGERALKIVWARETGATAEQQLAEVPSSAPDQQRLVTAVYEKRGSAPEIRAAIEADCMAEKEKLKQAQAMAAAAAQMMEKVPSDMRPAPAPATVSTGAAAPGVVQGDQKAAEAAERRFREEQHLKTCARLREDMATTRSQQRAGGDASTMDNLNERRRWLERSLASEGC